MPSNERQGTISHGAPPGRSDVGRRRVAAEDPPMMMPLGLSHDEQVNFDGIVNDAMGYVREGDIEHAETLLREAIDVAENDLFSRLACCES